MCIPQRVVTSITGHEPKTTWFNLWSKRLWPYDNVRNQDILYCYDSKKKKLVSKSVIQELRKFEYTNKKALLESLKNFLGKDYSEDPYFIEKQEVGFCFAFITNTPTRIDVKKPDTFKFHQSGWMNDGEAEVKNWLDDFDLIQAEAALDFDTHLLDYEYSRKRVLQSIVRRRGQSVFRQSLLDAYKNKCAVTGCNAAAALEAAHILPYSGEYSQHVTNGLLLRSDIHTLFDLNLLAINPDDKTVHLRKEIINSSYSGLHGTTISHPESPTDRPSTEALKKRWNNFRIKS